MRKGTKSFISILSLGLVAAGYQAGQSAELPSSFSAAAAPQTGGTSAGVSTGTSTGGTSAGSETVNTPAATPAAGSASTPAAATSGSTTAPAPASTPKATVAASAPISTPKATAAAPAPAATQAPPATNTGSATTKTGTAINYRYGTVQVSVTKTNGKITAVNLLQQGATGGRQGAFPYLVQYAIAANGTSFGNLGGATFTTDAFKQSLESALAKF